MRTLAKGETCGQKSKLRPEPDWNYIHKELSGKGVTLRLLWEEYKEDHQDGYQSTQFCKRYKDWKKTLSPGCAKITRPARKCSSITPDKPSPFKIKEAGKQDRLRFSCLILATSESMSDAFEIYSRRWEIETLFGCLKTRGFNFESTHLTDPERLSKLFALGAIAACWAHKVGEFKNKRKPIKIKKHEKKAKSIFRYGLDHIKSILNNILEDTLN